MSTPLDLDVLQVAYNVGASGAIMRLMPAIIAELRKARELLPHHCGDEVCERPVEFDSVLCGCACDECTAAESMGIYAHESAEVGGKV